MKKRSPDPRSRIGERELEAGREEREAFTRCCEELVVRSGFLRQGLSMLGPALALHLSYRLVVLEILGPDVDAWCGVDP